jgi:hypothetical protein
MRQGLRRGTSWVRIPSTRDRLLYSVLTRSARNAVGALQKRLAHRNPSVQLYALEVGHIIVTHTFHGQSDM